MRLFDEYIQHETTNKKLVKLLKEFQSTYSFRQNNKPSKCLDKLIDAYNKIGRPDIKESYEINQNLSRNLTGSLFQDYLTELALEMIFEYPNLQVLCEVRVPYGTFSLWDKGTIIKETPSEISDLAIGYVLNKDGKIVNCAEKTIRQPVRGLPAQHSIEPLFVFNSKIRVSQGEFFDWYGRKQRMNNNHPACISALVALRAEMNRKIPKITRVEDSFFLLGNGGEGRVTVNQVEFDRLVRELKLHLSRAME